MTLEDFLLTHTEYIKSIKDISYDKNHDIYLCDYLEKYISFDDFVKKYFVYGKLPSTPDMLIAKNNKIIFVEFKNQYEHRIDITKIHQKAIEGLLALYIICSKNNIDISSYQKNYIVVYKADNRNFLRQKFTNKFHKDNNSNSMILFNLDKLINRFYDNIATIICGNDFVDKIKEYGVQL